MRDKISKKNTTTSTAIARRLVEITGLSAELVAIHSHKYAEFSWEFRLYVGHTGFKCGGVRVTKMMNGSVEVGSVTHELFDGLRDVRFDDLLEPKAKPAATEIPIEEAREIVARMDRRLAEGKDAFDA
jgi:hypothetical protein